MIEIVVAATFHPSPTLIVHMNKYPSPATTHGATVSAMPANVCVHVLTQIMAGQSVQYITDVPMTGRIMTPPAAMKMKPSVSLAKSIAAEVAEEELTEKFMLLRTRKMMENAVTAKKAVMNKSSNCASLTMDTRGVRK